MHSRPYFFVFAGAAGTFFLGCWAWYCHKFLKKKQKKNDMLLQACHRWDDREIRVIYTQACTNVTRLRLCCLTTRQRSWFKFHGITRGTYKLMQKTDLTLFWKGFARVPHLQADEHNRLALLQGQPRVLCPTRFRKQVLLLLHIIQPKDENIISFIKISPCSRKTQAEKIKCVRKLRVVFICVWLGTDSI